MWAPETLWCKTNILDRQKVDILVATGKEEPRRDTPMYSPGVPEKGNSEGGAGQNQAAHVLPSPHLLQQPNLKPLSGGENQGAPWPTAGTSGMLRALVSSSDCWILSQWEHYGGHSQKYSMCMQNHAWEIKEIKQPGDKGPAHRQGAAAWAEKPPSPLPPRSVLQMLLPCNFPSYQQGWYIAEQRVFSVIWYNFIYLAICRAGLPWQVSKGCNST